MNKQKEKKYRISDTQKQLFEKEKIGANRSTEEEGVYWYIQ